MKAKVIKKSTKRLTTKEKVERLKERNPNMFQKGKDMIERIRAKRLLEERYDVDVDG